MAWQDITPLGTPGSPLGPRIVDSYHYPELERLAERVEALERQVRELEARLDRQDEEARERLEREG